MQSAKLQPVVLACWSKTAAEACLKKGCILCNTRNISKFRLLQNSVKNDPGGAKATPPPQLQATPKKNTNQSPPDNQAPTGWTKNTVDKYFGKIPKFYRNSFHRDFNGYRLKMSENAKTCTNVGKYPLMAFLRQYSHLTAWHMAKK